MTRIEAPEPGVYPDVPFETYKNWDAMNASTIKAGKATMLDMKHVYERTFEKDDTAALQFGRYLHTLVLEPDKLPDEYFYIDQVPVGEGEYEEWNGRKKVHKEWRAKQEAEGRQGVREVEHNVAKCMATSIASHHEGSKLLQPYKGRAELSIVWIDPVTEVTCKARIDKVHPNDETTRDTIRQRDQIADLKTAKTVDQYVFGRESMGYGYDLSAAFYLDGWATVTDSKQRAEFTIVAVQKGPPYHCRTFEFDEQVLDYARGEYQAILSEWALCCKKGNWPGYEAEKRNKIMLPAWKLDQQQQPEEMENGDEF